jgi:myo-inositol-1(or 4)-monophosphatase
LLTAFGDLRRLGCAQLVLAGVAAGRLHAAVSTVELNDWDTVAGVHLVRLAGGRVTDAAGDRWEPGATGLVASNGRAHEALLAVTRE